MREIRTEGCICIDDAYGFTYRIAKIEYIEREDESFEYIFRPNYSVISLLGDDIFQGIPGLDLDLGKEEYIRENRVPVFISERTPSKNREDLIELLDACGMDYLNRLEWLIRTDTRYSGDSLYVCRWEDKTADVQIESDENLGGRSALACKRLLSYICAGYNIHLPELEVSDNNRKDIYQLLLLLYSKEKTFLKNQQKAGVDRAVEQKRYKGRSKIEIDELRFQEVMNDYEDAKMTGDQAAKILGISRATFMRRIRERKKKL